MKRPEVDGRSLRFEFVVHADDARPAPVHAATGVDRVEGQLGTGVHALHDAGERPAQEGALAEQDLPVAGAIRCRKAPGG